MDDLSAIEMGELRSEIDRFARAIEPLVLYRLFAHDIADLDLTFLKLYLRGIPSEALMAIAAHHTDEIAFPGSPLGKVRDALAAQPPQHRRQLLGYQTSDGRLYHPEDITLVYALDQGEAQGGDHGG